MGPLVPLDSTVFVEGWIETDLDRNIAELDSAGAFKGGSGEVDALRYTDPRQAWSRVRRAWGRLAEMELSAQQQPDLF